MNWLTKFLNIEKLNLLLKRADYLQAIQELKILEHDLQTAQRHLKAHSHLKQLPLYLLLGAAQSGKTSLLFSADIKLTDTNSEPPKDSNNLNNLTATTYASWWFAPTAIFLDLGGNYHNPEDKTSYHNLIWQGFLRLLKKYRGENPINGVIVTIDLPGLANDKQLRQKTIAKMRERLNEIANLNSGLPIYLIFTKCDLIAGFTDFFGNLGIEERAQEFGISITRISPGPNNQALVTRELTNLLRKLADQLFFRMHQERDQNKHKLIKDFPVQLAQLQPIITEIINKLPTHPKLPLTGVYFTSSIQKGVPFNFVEKIICPIVGWELTSTNQFDRTLLTHSYFLDNIFKRVLATPITISTKTTRFSRYFWQLFLTLFITIFCGIFWYFSYTKNLATINAITTLNRPANFSEEIAQLSNAQQVLARAQTKWWSKFGFHELVNLSDTLQKQQQELANNFIVKNLQRILESQLVVNETTNPRKLYDTLKAYLMLTMPQKLEVKYLEWWLSDYWKNNSAVPSKLFLNQINNLKIPSHRPLISTPNRELVAKARERLAAAPSAVIAYLLLENQYVGQNLIFTNHLDNSATSYQQIGISKLYTQENLPKVYYQEIPALVNTLAAGDWVLGQSLKAIATPGAITTLIEQTRANYSNKYTETWQNFLTSIKIAPFENLNSATELLATLGEPNSFLLQALQLIKSNTTFSAPPSPQFTRLLEERFANLAHFDLGLLQKHLSILTSYFANITKNSDQSKAAFTATLTHIANISGENNSKDDLTNFSEYIAQTPVTVQPLLQSLTSSLWQALLTNCKDYISLQWQTTVYPHYQKTLLNLYPLFSTAENAASLDDFALFFGPNGIMEQFFSTFLKPFVDTSQMYWSWKSFDNQRLNFSQATLEMFIRADLIQKMFFPNKQAKMLTKFNLVPIALTPHTKKFTLNLEGQIISYIPGENKISPLIWPGSNQGEITLEFISQTDKSITNKFVGPWAWFKLLDKANLSVPNDKVEHYELLFDLNGNAIKYQLIPEQPINPFIADIVNTFRCSEKLN